MEHVVDNYTNCNWCVWNSNKRIAKGTWGPGSWRTGGDHPNDSTVENGQNTKKSPGDLRRLAVTQTPVKNQQLTLMWKALRSKIIIIIIIIHGVAFRENRVCKMSLIKKKHWFSVAFKIFCWTIVFLNEEFFNSQIIFS